MFLILAQSRIPLSSQVNYIYDLHRYYIEYKFIIQFMYKSLSLSLSLSVYNFMNYYYDYQENMKNLLMFNASMVFQVLGAFWYFLSIEREIACWHEACENHIECNQTFFQCDNVLHKSGNYAFLNDVCQIDPPYKSKTLFDFGIFLEALQSRVVQSKKFSEKFFHCFWWGLRNLRFARIDSAIPYY